MTLIGRLRSGLRRTAERLGTRVDEILGRDDESGRKVLANPETLEALEELLIEADVGVTATTRIVETLRSRLTAGSVNLRDELKHELLRILEAAGTGTVPSVLPKVVLVVGVNGTGKTTTVGKLAQALKSDGKSVLVCAADTFRAAAVEQLEVWAGRVEVDIVKASPAPTLHLLSSTP